MHWSGSAPNDHFAWAIAMSSGRAVISASYAVVAGVAIFDDLSITMANILTDPLYSLDATSGTLPLVTSITFNIT